MNLGATQHDIRWIYGAGIILGSPGPVLFRLRSRNSRALLLSHRDRGELGQFLNILQIHKMHLLRRSLNRLVWRGLRLGVGFDLDRRLLDCLLRRLRSCLLWLSMKVLAGLLIVLRLL